MLNLLIAIPFRKGLHPYLAARMQQLLAAVLEDKGNRMLFEMESAVHENEAIEAPAGVGRWWQQARARNELVSRYVKQHHDLVLWLDADLVDYPADLPARLYQANPTGITAPMVFVEKTWQFYDLFGFVQEGRRSNPYPPYFDRVNGHELVELDGVGCCYLMPAWLLGQVAYESRPVDRTRDHPLMWETGHTDHWPVMKAARAADLTIGCLTTLTAYHAYLPKYGEQWH